MNNLRDFKTIDIIPAISGLIGKIALVSSFAIVWAEELNILFPNFVLHNVRIELLISCIISLILMLINPKLSPIGTLAPLVILIPLMVSFGVNPLYLGIVVGIIGLICVKLGVLDKFIDLSKNMTKLSISLVIGISGVIVSLERLYIYYTNHVMLLIIFSFTIILLYFLLTKYNKGFLIIPLSFVIGLISAYYVGINLDNSIGGIILSPSRWWNDIWEVDTSFNFLNILFTIPFALFAIVLWSIDTVSIMNIKESYNSEIELDIDKSFALISIRNIIGTIMGGAQTASLWRSYLIPQYMISRPRQLSVIAMCIVGIVISIYSLPLQLLTLPPVIWTVMLFGVFVPFIRAGITKIKKLNSPMDYIVMIVLVLLGVTINLFITFIGALIYDNLINKKPTVANLNC